MRTASRIVAASAVLAIFMMAAVASSRHDASAKYGSLFLDADASSLVLESSASPRSVHVSTGTFVPSQLYVSTDIARSGDWWEVSVHGRRLWSPRSLRVGLATSTFWDGEVYTSARTVVLDGSALNLSGWRVCASKAASVTLVFGSERRRTPSTAPAYVALVVGPSTVVRVRLRPDETVLVVGADGRGSYVNSPVQYGVPSAYHESGEADLEGWAVSAGGRPATHPDVVLYVSEHAVGDLLPVSGDRIQFEMPATRSSRGSTVPDGE